MKYTLYSRSLVLILFVVIAIIAPDNALAQNTQTSHTSSASENDDGRNLSPTVLHVEKYLRSLGTATARFLQTAQDGSQLIGSFYLDRPGKLRFDYDDPIEDFIVADGFFIYFYDAAFGEQTNAPIGQTLADFLLRKDLRLSDEVTVTKTERHGELLQVSLVQTADPEAGTLVLGFTENPFALKKWRVVDSTNSITEIELFNLKTGIELEKSLFVYINPNRLKTIPAYNQ